MGPLLLFLFLAFALALAATIAPALLRASVTVRLLVARLLDPLRLFDALWRRRSRLLRRPLRIALLHPRPLKAARRLLRPRLRLRLLHARGTCFVAAPVGLLRLLRRRVGRPR